MTSQDRFTRLLTDWLEDAPTRAPEPLLAAVVDGLRSTPQRLGWRTAVRRAALPRSAVMRLATALSVALVVAVVGYELLGGRGPLVPGPGESPSPRPATPAPSATPSASASPYVSAAPESPVAPPVAPTRVPSTSATFTTAGPFAPRFSHTATLLHDGRVLIVGGDTSTDGTADAPTGSAELWNPATGAFSPTGSLMEPRFNHTATLLPDGRVLIVGGVGSARRVAGAEIWDPATGSFSRTGSLHAFRVGHTATALPDGRVLIVGGGSVARTKGPLPYATNDSAEIWDPASGSFRTLPGPAKERDHHTATLLPDGRVLIVGGGGVGLGESGAAELWDPATERFSPTGVPSIHRESHTATLLPDGRVLIVGGDTLSLKDTGYSGPLATAEVWDPASGAFDPTGSMTQRRYIDTANLLPDGRVLIIGGDGQRGPGLVDRGIVGAELWDPDTGTFSPAGSLAEGRGTHTATLLGDGRVLVIGGWSVQDFGRDLIEFARSAELWSLGPN